MIPLLLATALMTAPGVSLPEGAVSKEFNTFNASNVAKRSETPTWTFFMPWTRIETESSCGDVVEKLADWFFPVGSSLILGEGMVSCYTRDKQKNLYVKLIMEASSAEVVEQFETFRRDREAVPVYGHKIVFLRVFGVAGFPEIRSGVIPGDLDPWYLSSFIQLDRSSRMFPSYGAWLSWWWNYLNRAGTSLAGLIAAIKEEFSAGLAEHYRSAVCPKVNGIALQADVALVVNSRELIQPSGGFYVVHDCRFSDSRTCNCP